MTLDRRAWTDSIIEFLSLLMIFCALVIAKRGRITIIPAITFFLAAVYVVLVKESSVVVIGSAGLIVAAHLIEVRDFKRIFIFALLALSAFGSGFAILCSLVGGVDQLLLVYDHIRESVPNAPYATRYQDGTTIHLAYTSFLLSPGFTILFFISSVTLVADLITNKQSSNPFLNRTLMVFLVVIALFSVAISIPDYFMNMRYLSPVVGLAYICAASLPARFLNEMNPLNRYRSILILSIVFGAILIIDLTAYTNLIIGPDCADLNLLMIKQCLTRSLGS